MELVAKVTEAFGDIDMLVVSTAANVLPRLVGDIAPEDITRILVEQAAAPMVLRRAVMLVMRASGAGSLVVVASDAAKSATTGASVVGAALAALPMFARAMALQDHRAGLRVHIAPPP